jgi:hypothetical protein
LDFLDSFKKKHKISNVMKTSPVGAELFRCGQTETERHDEANSHFWQLLRTRPKNASVPLQAAELHAEDSVWFPNATRTHSFIKMPVTTQRNISKSKSAV